MKIKLSLTTLFITISFQVFAQLKIGDKIPDAVMENIIHYKSATARLSDFKGKMLIIDFWATWCVPCVRALPGLDSLQHQFKDELVVLPVTSEKTEKVITFLKNIPSLKNNGLPFITQCTSLDTLFPHHSVPHDVVIDKTGKVLAITSIENITPLTVASLLKGENPAMKFKKTIENFNSQRPFLQEIGETVLYQFIITNYYEGLLGEIKRKGQPKYPLDTMLTGTNMWIANIYRSALLHKLASPGDIPGNRMQLLTKDSALFIYPHGVPGNVYDEWTSRSCFCFNMIIPPHAQLNVYDELKTNLDHYFNYNSRIEKKILKCFIIINTDSSKYKSGGGQFLFDRAKSLWTLTDYPFEELLKNINYITNLPVINETGYAGRISIKIAPNFNDFQAFKKQLNDHGMDLKEAERTLDVMIIEDRK